MVALASNFPQNGKIVLHCLVYGKSSLKNPHRQQFHPRHSLAWCTQLCWCFVNLSSFWLKRLNSSAHVPFWCFFNKVCVLIWLLWQTLSDPLMPGYSLFWCCHFNLIVAAFFTDTIQGHVVVWTANNWGQRLRNAVFRRLFCRSLSVMSLTFSWSKHTQVFLSDTFLLCDKEGTVLNKL